MSLTMCIDTHDQWTFIRYVLKIALVLTSRVDDTKDVVQDVQNYSDLIRSFVPISSQHNGLVAPPINTVYTQ